MIRYKSWLTTQEIVKYHLLERPVPSALISPAFPPNGISWLPTSLLLHITTPPFNSSSTWKPKPVLVLGCVLVGTALITLGKFICLWSPLCIAVSIKWVFNRSPLHRSGYGTTPTWTNEFGLRYFASEFAQIENFFAAVGGGARYTLGLNFRLQNDFSYVTNETNYILQVLGKPAYLQAIEIGNECDLYSSNGYRTGTWNPYT